MKLTWTAKSEINMDTDSRVEINMDMEKQSVKLKWKRIDKCEINMAQETNCKFNMVNKANKL